MSPNNQNYCGVSYFLIVTKTVNKRSLGQNDTAWLGQNDTVWNNLIWLCFKAFSRYFLSKLSIPTTRKLNDTAMSEKYHFIFQNVKNGWSTVSFCPVAKHKTWMVTNVTQKIQNTVRVNHISVVIYSIINCLIVFIVISVLRLEYLNLRWEKSYCIILPRVLYHFAPCTGQNDTADHTFWMFDFKHQCHFMPVFLSLKL